MCDEIWMERGWRDKQIKKLFQELSQVLINKCIKEPVICAII